MLGAGARAVVGVDPFLLFHYQFRALQTYLAQPALVHLPIPFGTRASERAHLLPARYRAETSLLLR